INAALKIRSLNQRFVLMAKVASITKSNSLLDTLQGVIPSYLDDSSVAAGTLAILDVLARNGRAEAALEAARAIQDDLSRASALGTVGAAANDAGLVLEGLAIIQNNESGASDFTIRLAIRTFPEHLLEVGMLQEAIPLANTFDSGGAHSNKLASISSMLAESGRIDEAIVVASQIDNNGTEAGGLPVSLFRDRAIAAVIVALANAERFEETQAALLDFENHAGADTVKAQVAIAYANAGHYNEAMALLSQIENTKAITYAKLGIVTVLAKNGAVNDALSLAHSIDSNYRRARAYAEIAVQLE
ncbi:MAG: hypothetical protein KAG66_15910, partial [Methylococcales bacterium]|nr:hypothetical protein [Methylococcales bacterium]